MGPLRGKSGALDEILIRRWRRREKGGGAAGADPKREVVMEMLEI